MSTSYSRGIEDSNLQGGDPPTPKPNYRQTVADKTIPCNDSVLKTTGAVSGTASGTAIGTWDYLPVGLSAGLPISFSRARFCFLFVARSCFLLQQRLPHLVGVLRGPLHAATGRRNPPEEQTGQGGRHRPRHQLRRVPRWKPLHGRPIQPGRRRSTRLQPGSRRKPQF